VKESLKYKVRIASRNYQSCDISLFQKNDKNRESVWMQIGSFASWVALTPFVLQSTHARPYLKVLSLSVSCLLFSLQCPPFYSIIPLTKHQQQPYFNQPRLNFQHTKSHDRRRFRLRPHACLSCHIIIFPKIMSIQHDHTNSSLPIGIGQVISYQNDASVLRESVCMEISQNSSKWIQRGKIRDYI